MLGQSTHRRHHYLAEQAAKCYEFGVVDVRIAVGDDAVPGEISNASGGHLRVRNAYVDAAPECEVLAQVRAVDAELSRVLELPRVAVRGA